MTDRHFEKNPKFPKYCPCYLKIDSVFKFSFFIIQVSLIKHCCNETELLIVYYILTLKRLPIYIQIAFHLRFLGVVDLVLMSSTKNE